MKNVIDMNLSIDWIPVLTSQHIEAVHWSTVGDPRASDREIMTWAFQNGYIVFTHDLDFGDILAATGTRAPSVIQLRGQDVLPKTLGSIVMAALQNFSDELAQGALISLDLKRARIRILPIASPL